MKSAAKQSYPIIWIGSKIPDYLALVVENGLGLDLEATHHQPSLQLLSVLDFWLGYMRLSHVWYILWVREVTRN